MAFVIEEIPMEQKSKFPFPVLTNPYTMNPNEKNPTYPTLYKWAIDRERNAYLVKSKKWGGGASDTPEEVYWTFVWNDYIIHMRSDDDILIRDNHNNLISKRVLSKFIFPVSLSLAGEEKIQESLLLIKEAFQKVGGYWNPEDYFGIIIEIDLSNAIYK